MLTELLPVEQLTAKVIWDDDRWHTVRDSIRDDGMREPLMVVPWSPSEWARWVAKKPKRRAGIPAPLVDGCHLVVVIGCQRLQAVQDLGWSRVPVVVCQTKREALQWLSAAV